MQQIPHTMFDSAIVRTATVDTTINASSAPNLSVSKSYQREMHSVVQ